jgi:hypothetical protein
MIYEERVYTIKPGSTAVYLKNYEELALDILMECLGNLVGFWYTEHGHVNQLVHIWSFEGLDDRLERRQRLAAHPGWPAYLDVNLPLLLDQQSRIMLPAPFSPLQ